ncbi:MAG: type II toxin-antitoxin system HicB family antitoxin [Candidatus Rokubacteria bacterium]|nr:type II toxin-antitoxin system HicB family antitoxin [Candidatus Rokubacteria bacterium]
MKPARRASTATLHYWRDGRWYVGQLVEVPGVFSQGTTLRALEANIREAYQLVREEQPTVRRRQVHRRRIAFPA